MAKIGLIAIAIENFRSFRAPEVVEFRPQAGLKFLGGLNEVEPRLGANGAGKSTLWDAFFWCLYNQSVRGLKASDLVSGGAKRPHVTVVLEVDGAEHEIERWGSPNQLTLDGQPAEDADVLQLVRLSRARAAQSLVFGQMMPFFLDLPMAARSEILDEVLDLRIWQQASELAAKDAQGARLEVATFLGRVQHYEGRLAALPDPQELERQAVAWEASYDTQIDHALAHVEELEGRLEAAQERAKPLAIGRIKARLRDSEAAVAAARKDVQQLTYERAEAEAGYRSVRERLEVLKKVITAKTCHVCGGPADGHTHDEHDHTAALLQGWSDRGQEIKSRLMKAEAEMDQLEEMLAADRRELADAQAEERQAQGAIRQAEEDLARAVRTAEAIGNMANPHAEALKARQAQHAEWSKARVDAQSDLDDAEGAALHLEFWKEHFRRVRLYEVNKILAQLDLEVANAASLLGLGGWRIHFATETQNKSGGTKLGVQVQIQSPDGLQGPWESWSGGEGQRIRIAVAMGLSSLIQGMAGVNFTFEVWDEPSAWLSTEGIEDLLECLKYRAQATGKSIWLLDHRALIHSGFSEMWQVRKSAKGSSVELLRTSTAV